MPTDPIRRPRDPQRAARIITAARELIRERGVHEVTHRTVAARAGVPLGSTTYYFATMDDLLERAISEDIAAFRERMAQALAATEGEEPAVRALHLLSLDEGAQVRADDYVLFIAALSRPSLHHVARAWSDALIEVFESFLPRDAARALSVIIEGIGIREVLAGPDHLPPKQLTATQISAILEHTS